MSTLKHIEKKVDKKSTLRNFLLTEKSLQTPRKRIINKWLDLIRFENSVNII